MSVRSKLKLLAKLRNKEYRDAYVEEHVKTSLPFQIKALRDQRRWTQGKLAREAKTTQTVISRIENPEYGHLSLNSLYKLAAAFDVALLIKFVPFSRLLSEFEDVSPAALEVKSFEEELPDMEASAVTETAFGAFSKIQGVRIFTIQPPDVAGTYAYIKGISTAERDVQPPVRIAAESSAPRLDIQDVSTGWPM